MHEVAVLLTVFEYQGGLPVQQSRTKIGEHSCIRIRQRLTWPKHVEQAQSNRFDSVVGADDKTASFLTVFRKSIDRGEIGLLLLIGRHRDKATAARQHGIPTRSISCDASPNRTNRRAIFGGISPFAIH